MSIINLRELKVQEAIDQFYTKSGPCCAGCDWWHHMNSVIGECHRSAPVSSEQRLSMVRINWTSYHFEPQAGHILTNREHHCGDFKDEFDWSSLPAAYLKRIGKSA